MARIARRVRVPTRTVYLSRRRRNGSPQASAGLYATSVWVRADCPGGDQKMSFFFDKSMWYSVLAAFLLTSFAHALPKGGFPGDQEGPAALAEELRSKDVSTRRGAA